MSKRKRWLAVIAGLVLLVSLALLAWGALPGARQTRVVPVPPANLSLPTP
jgi:hypothetical protein